ncbi:hypothetical protein, partial [Microbulbifer mangrovi]|uniref:hypothetical protein n=1 Tax=Microbulbifer mangrovi TaxID=927787 RepID=UPI00130142B7
SQSAAQTFALNENLQASANSWSMGDSALLQTGGTLAITTAAGMDLAQLESGSTVALDSGAGIALRESLTAA